MVAASAMACVQPAYAGLPDMWERIYRTAYVFSVIGAYPTTMVIGVPIFFFLRHQVAASSLNCALTGACVAGVPWVALSLFSRPNYTARGWVEFGEFVLEIAAFGALGGLVFWLIAAAGRPKANERR
jgi:hypothetical protein